MTANEIILIISPFDAWGLNTLSLHNAVEKDYYYDIICKTEAENQNDGHSMLNALIDVCSKCDPQNIYQKYGKGKYRKIEDFYLKGEQKIKVYIKQLSDKYISEAIHMADKMDIKIFYRNKNKEELLKKNILSLSAAEIVPRMSFNKTENGIDYNLKLSDGNSTFIPCKHSTRLLSDNPGVLVIDNTIYLLPEDFSGKIILPFVDKENIFIPKHMQNEYFRKFILKNVYKSEISAEGFDVIEEYPEMTCELSLHTDVFDRCRINITFMYGEHIRFTCDATADKHVRLEEDGNEGFRFVKVKRNAEHEKQIMDFLTEELKMPTDYRHKYELIEWLNENNEELTANSISFVQESSHIYVIGKTEIKQTVERDNDWFQLFIQIVLEDGTTLKFSDIKEYLQKGEREVRLSDGRYFIIPEEWFAQYAGTAMFGRVKGDKIYLHKSQQNIISCNSFKKEDINETEYKQISLPSRLNAQLRNYQKEGYEWLFHNLLMQTGCCLSDDMGLGKTIQTIALILKYKEIGKKYTNRNEGYAPNMLFSNNEMHGITNDSTQVETEEHALEYRTNIVISPASVVHNWRNELKKFAPSLNVLEYIGNQEERKKKRTALMTWDVVLTTYQTMRNDIETLSKYKYGIIVFDEAQCFKNRNSQTYRSVLMLNGMQKEALSGTPMENSLNDLWSLMNVLNPMLLGEYKSFNRNYIAPITSNLMSEKTAILKKLITPYFLKRTKEEVLPELPSRQDEIIVCEMSDEQKRIYDEELSKARNMILSYKSALLGENAVSNQSDNMPVHVLTAITRLRQIANHPILAKDKDNKNGNGYEEIQNLCEGSGKMSEIFSKLENLHGTSHKVLLFSESVSFLLLIANEMKSRNWKYEMLTGETSDRESAIKRFTETPSCQYFLISLKAGGVGLNLTTADYVFILDPWWNKSAEEQAISRSHRIGQKNSVFVYRFISKNSLEEQIMNLQERKQSLIESVMPFIEGTKK